MADNETSTAPLGPWAGDNLQTTAAAGAGIGADAGLPIELRFVRNVIDVVRRRYAQSSASADAKKPAVFLLQPDPSLLKLSSRPTRVPMLDNGLTPLTGRLWFLGGAPSSGHYSEEAPFDNDDDSLFNFVENLGQASLPALIYDPRPDVPQARYYPRGLGSLDHYESVGYSSEDVDENRVLAVIEKVYHTSLATPGAQKQNRVWEDPKKFWPCEEAETTIQGVLKAGLAGHFLTCTIRDEQSMTEGRLDLEIEQSDPLDRGKITRHAILELKVLRSYGATGHSYSAAYNEDWVRSGVVQAASYQANRNARWSALFCFDMRQAESGQKCFDHVLVLANTKKVLLKCWHIFASAKSQREATA